MEVWAKGKKVARLYQEWKLATTTVLMMVSSNTSITIHHPSYQTHLIPPVLLRSAGRQSQCQSMKAYRPRRKSKLIRRTMPNLIQMNEARGSHNRRVDEVIVPGQAITFILAPQFPVHLNLLHPSGPRKKECDRIRQLLNLPTDHLSLRAQDCLRLPLPVLQYPLMRT